MIFKDQIGHVIELSQKPKRIISLVPSQSEYLWEIGLREEIIGITKFCIHPDEMYRSVERVGGTKNLDIEKIRALKPDLIIGNKEENSEEQIKILQTEFNVWLSDIYNFNDAFEMMEELGKMTGIEKKSLEIIKRIKASLPQIEKSFSELSVAYFIWNKPYMLAAKNTFIAFILDYIGLKNVATHLERYPEVNEEELRVLNPQIIFLSSEPFPFKEKHIEELKNILPDSKIFIVDGEMFSWYGSRLLYLADYLKELKKEIGRN